VSITLAGLVIPSGGAFWPIHNVINACIAITVSRIMQLPKLGWILALLALLMTYDVFFVSGSQVLTDGGMSIMESVAKSKLQTDIAYDFSGGSTSSILSVATSETGKDIVQVVDESFRWIATLFKWRPSLFEVAIDGRVSDALGLGDVVFPAILGGWSYRYDKAQTESSNAEAEKTFPLFSSCVGGYVIGCIACEIFQTGQGQPALIFFVPSMLLSLGLASIRSKMSIKDMFEFDG
jgi:hypothetical protein